MKKIVFIVTIITLLTGVFAFGVMACGKGARMGSGMGSEMGPMGKFSNCLNLTFDQQQKILGIRQDFQKNTLSLRFNLQKKKLKLRQLWAAKPLDQAAIETKTKEITTLRVKMTTKVQAMQKKIKGVLTTEQLKKLNDSNLCKYGPGFGRSRRHGGRGCKF